MALVWGAGDVWTSVSKGRIRDALWRHGCAAETISAGIMKPGGASGIRRWAPDIDCHSKRWGEWRFIFPICTRRCATIKAQLALRRQWFAFTNHIGSVLIASTSRRGAPRPLSSVICVTVLFDWLHSDHFPFSSWILRSPDWIPQCSAPTPSFVLRSPDGICPHICIVQTEWPNNPQGMFQHPGKFDQKTLPVSLYSVHFSPSCTLHTV